MRALLASVVVITAAVAGAAGFVMGARSSAVVVAQAPAVTARASTTPVQARPGQLPQAPNDPRELVPLGPGPGEGPGQRPGEQPGQQPVPGECPVLLYMDGQLYEMPQPGQQPGQRPGQGPGDQPGPGGGGDRELMPLRPYQGPPIPGLPTNPLPPRRT